MTTDTDPAGRRIMNHLGETTHIPYLPIEEGDAGILVGLPLSGLFLSGLLGLNSLALPMIVSGLAIGFGIIYVTPPHLNAWTWLTDIARYHIRPRITFSAPLHPDPSTNEAERNRGGIANNTPFKPDERTQDITGVARAWPGASTIQRDDGTMEAFLEINPGNMDFAMSTDWARLQRIGEEFANTELDSTLKFHATTRSFPVDQLTANIEDRLTDPDVTENPILRELLEEYRETRPEDMEARGIQDVQYYLGVQVTPRDVYSQYDEEATPIEKLTELPLVGFLFNVFVSKRAGLSGIERQAKMFDLLDQRVADVRTHFVQQAPGWSARRLTTIELFALTMAFWNGHPHDPDFDPSIRERHVIDHARREDESDA